MCDRKKKEENKIFEEEAEKAKTEKEVQKVINEERRKRKDANQDIEIVGWKRKFYGFCRRGREENQARRKRGKDRGDKEDI